MALTLKIALHGVFFVDNKPVRVTEIQTPERFKLTVEDKFLPVEHQITADAAVEIMPNVRVSAGLRGTMADAVVVIQAPRHIKIARAELLKR